MKKTISLVVLAALSLPLAAAPEEILPLTTDQIREVIALPGRGSKLEKQALDCISEYQRYKEWGYALKILSELVKQDGFASRGNATAHIESTMNAAIRVINSGGAPRQAHYDSAINLILDVLKAEPSSWAKETVTTIALKEDSVRLFSGLFKANHQSAFEVATEIVKERIVPDYRCYTGVFNFTVDQYQTKKHRLMAIELLAELVKANYEPAIEVAIKALEDERGSFKGAEETRYQYYLPLFLELVKINYEPVFSIALEHASSRMYYPAEIPLCLDIFSELIKLNYKSVFKPALAAALRAIKYVTADDHYMLWTIKTSTRKIEYKIKIRQASIELFIQLVQANYEPAFPPAMKVATQGIDDATTVIQEAAIKLHLAILYNKQGIRSRL